MYGEAEFSKDVIVKFGADIPELREDAGHIHTQMSHLAESIRDRGSRTEEVLAFLEVLLNRSDAVLEIENAIAISFIELEELPGLGLKDKLPKSVLRVLKEQNQRWLNAT